MAHRKRTVQLHFMVTEHERELIRQKMEQLGTNNLGAYLRKMAIDGYIVKLDLPELSELLSLLRRTSNNINQVARRVHPCFVNGAWFPKLGGRTAGYRSVLPLLFSCR